MSSENASGSKAPDSSSKTTEILKEDETQPQLVLGVLEEDDEFEEFAVAGTRSYSYGRMKDYLHVHFLMQQIGTTRRPLSRTLEVLHLAQRSRGATSYGKTTGTTMTSRMTSVYSCGEYGISLLTSCIEMNLNPQE